MSSFWNFIFGATLVIVWIISGGFVTQANIFLSPYSNKDSDLHRAYWFTFWAAFVTWFLVALFILLVVLSIVGTVALFSSGIEEASLAAQLRSGSGSPIIETGTSWFTILFLLFALGLVGVTGVLAALAASAMARSPNFDRTVANLNTAYKDCVIAAIVCLGVGGLMIIGIIIYIIVGIQRQRRIRTELADINTLKRREVIRQAKEQYVLTHESYVPP